MTVFTKAQIYQMSVDRIERITVSDVTDTSRVVKWLNRNYDLTKESLLATHRWKFAKERAKLAADVVAPAFGWAFRYQAPSGCLFLYQLTADGDIRGPLIPYEYEGGYINTDAGPPLSVRFIKNVTEDRFTPLFTSVLCATFAWQMSHWLTRKASYKQIAEKEMKDAVHVARTMDAIENYAEPAAFEDVISVRYS